MFGFMNRSKIQEFDENEDNRVLLLNDDDDYNNSNNQETSIDVNIPHNELINMNEFLIESCKL